MEERKKIMIRLGKRNLDNLGKEWKDEQGVVQQYNNKDGQ